MIVSLSEAMNYGLPTRRLLFTIPFILGLDWNALTLPMGRLPQCLRGLPIKDWER